MESISTILHHVPLYYGTKELLVIEALIRSPSKHFPLNNTFCSSRNFVISSLDVKFSSRDTALDFNIFFGTRAVIKPVAYTN